MGRKSISETQNHHPYPYGTESRRAGLQPIRYGVLTRVKFKSYVAVAEPSAQFAFTNVNINK